MSTKDQATVTDQTGTDMSLTEAIESLTVGEVQTIERHYGRTLDGGKLSGTDLTVAVIWALERRRALAEKAAKLPDWNAFGDWSMKRVNGYFPEEAVEADPAEPESAEGKGV